MCVGTPMQVVAIEPGVAVCEGRGRRERIVTALVGETVVGTWLLAYQGTAVRSLTADEAAQTTAALDALDAVAAGRTDVDAFFADLIGREPELPAHLKPGTP